jgi:AcrR family transcriptional regulator
MAPGIEGGESAIGLARLPPGRHGLERDFVVRNQRDRLTAGVIATVAANGYHEATITHICRAAGVSRRTFYSYYSSKEACYIEALGRITDYLSATLAQSGDDGSPWPLRVRRRLDSLLAVFAANPDLVRFAWIAPLRAGEQIAGQHHHLLELVRQALVADKPEGLRQPSPIVEQSLVGGMMALIAARVESGEGSELAELLADLVEMFLAPFLGRADAVRAAIEVA